MTFVVLEGFSGTGKTTLAKELERIGWLRLTESAHAVPVSIPVGERADTFADFSLLGATMVYCSVISDVRGSRDIVSEGYMLSDLAYARIRYELKKSEAFPAMLDVCRSMLANRRLRPDLYIVLEARQDTIDRRQIGKNGRDRNQSEQFRTRYYSALAEMHVELGESNVEKMFTDSDASVTLRTMMGKLRERKLVE